MKRSLLLSLFLSLLVGCSSKDNGIINLECSFDYWRTSNDSKGSYHPIEAYWLKRDLKINEKDKKVLMIYELNEGIKKEKMVDNILITNSLLKFQVSNGGEYKYEINRINGKIDMLWTFKNSEVYAKYKGKCYVPEDLENLF